MKHPEIWTSAECAAALGVPPRYFGDLTRDSDYAQVIPKPFGKAGNSQLWDAAGFRAAIPRIRKVMAGAQDRSTARRLATLAEQEEAMQRRWADIQREMKKTSEQYAHFRQCEADHQKADALEAEKFKRQRAYSSQGPL